MNSHAELQNKKLYNTQTDIFSKIVKWELGHPKMFKAIKN